MPFTMIIANLFIISYNIVCIIFNKYLFMKLSESINRKLGAFLSMFNMVMNMAMGLVYTPICVRFLGNSEYGLITFAQSLISYLSILDMGFGSAVVRYCSRAKEQGEDESVLYGFFLVLFSIIGVVALVLGLFLYGNLETTFSSGLSSHELLKLKPIFLLLLINVVLGFPSGVFSSIVSAHEKFVFLRVSVILKSLLTHLINILVLFLGFRSITITFITVLFSLLVYCANVYYCFVRLHVTFKFARLDKCFYKDIISYSFFIFIGMLGGQLYDETDKIVLGKFVGSEEVAVYGIGVTFYTYFKLMALNITNVFFPMINKLSVGENSIEQLSKLFNRIARILIVALGFILLGFTFFGKEFTILWVGESYINSYWIALIIMVPNLVPWAQSLGTSILEALNKHRVNSIMYIVIAVINVIISIPLAIRFGGIGAALGTAIGTILGRWLFLNYYYDHAIGLDIKGFWKEFINIGVRFIPIVIIFYGINLIPVSLNWFTLIIKIIMSCFIALPYIYYFVFNQSEKSLFGGFLNKFKKHKGVCNG